MSLGYYRALMRTQAPVLPPDWVKLTGSVNNLRNFGAVLAPNGNIYSPAYNTSNVYKIDTSTDTVSSTTARPTGHQSYSAALAQNGLIYMNGWSGDKMLEFDPSTDSITEVGAAISGNRGSTLLGEDGNIYTNAYNFNTSGTAMMEFNISTYAITYWGTIPSSRRILGMCHGLNGKFYAWAFTGRDIFEIDPVLKTITSVGVASGSGNLSSTSSTVDASGNIYSANFTGTTVYKYNPSSGVITSIDLPTDTTSQPYRCAKLAGNGKIYYFPWDQTRWKEIDPATNTVQYVAPARAGADAYSGIAQYNGNLYSFGYGVTTGQYKLFNVDNPDVIGSDLNIPSVLSTLPTSNYNKLFNYT